MKNQLPSLIAASCLLVLTGVRPAAATVLVSVSDTAPTSSFASNTSTAGGVQWRNNTASGLRDVGQSFLASTNLTLDSITFRLAPDAAPGAGALTAAFSVSIFQVSSASGVPSGTALYTETGTMSGLTGTSSDFSKYVTFNLTDVALTGGNYYAVMLYFPTQAANRNVTWQVSNSASYTGGMAIVSTDNTNYSGWGSGSDLVFYATAVPEPSTVVLGLLGLAFVVLRRRASRPRRA